MKKIIILIALLFLIPSHAYYNEEKIWKMQYDGYHNCTREWWNVDAFIKADKNYSITASFEYEKETPAANLFFTVFDWDEKIVYDCGSYGDNISTLQCSGKYYVNLTYGKSWMKGGYPSYKVHFENKGIVVEMELIAEAKAKFVVEEEGGVLPMGFGYYRYLFIPKCKARGWISINGEIKNFEGIAYYEHVWGNWSYHNPLKGATISPYLNLARWWWKNKNISFDSLTLSSNNPFGYDWAWIAFENGWSIFYGVIPFWIGEIPLGIAYLYNGSKIIEFGSINYEYLDGVFYGGTYIPTKIKVVAKGKGELSFIMEMKNKPHIYENKLHSLYWKKLILYECPGNASGYYKSLDGKRIKLIGKCEIEIERQISIFEYVMFKIMPYSDGFQFIFLSYLLNFMIILQLSLHPFSINFSFSNIR